jgi:hypothetical protein
MIGSRVIATAGLVSRTVVSRLVFETGIRHLADLNKTPIILKLETESRAREMEPIRL